MQEQTFKIQSSDTKMETLLKDETLFVQSNGSIGSRNHFTEGYGSYDHPVTLMNGYFNTYPFKYEENYDQFPQVGETIVNLPDASRVDIFFDQHPIHLEHMTLIENHREYDLQTGCVKRQSTYQEGDLVIQITEEKLVAHDVDLIITKLTLKANRPGKFELLSKLRMPRLVQHTQYDPRLAHAKKHLNLLEMTAKNNFGYCTVETTHTQQKMRVYVSHSIPMIYTVVSDDIQAKTTFSFESEPIVLTKYAYFTKNMDEPTHIKPAYFQETFENRLLKEYKRLHEFWKQSNIHVDHPKLDTILKYNVFMLHHHSPSDGLSSIAAKGISGEGYEGHYFWDTETYMLPYFILTNPVKAKSLLMYRYHNLDKAKHEARNLGAKRGAKIPWRTISGHESSPYYPAGSAQIHINSDVALAVMNYYYATNDFEFMMSYGLELLIETALFYLEYGSFAQGQFHLNGVTGPDEYTALVNDNYYTNRLAQIHMQFVCDFISKHKDTVQPCLDKLEIQSYDLDQMALAAKQMTLLVDSSLGIYKQDEGFLNKQELPIESIPKTNFPLLLHYHPLYIYRHQILKQADTVLAMILENHPVNPRFQKTTDYYLKRTTHDSSLSKCAYGIAKYRLGETKQAFEYFESIAELDFLDLKQHTKHGLHMANAGGSYLMVMYGLLGLQFGPHLVLAPVRQSEIKSIDVSFRYQGCALQITVENNTICIKTDHPIQICVYGETMSVMNQLIFSVK